MAKKLASIVAILIVVSLAILGVGWYSIGELNSTMADLGRTAKRTSSLNTIDKITLERRMDLVRIIDSLDENYMLSLIDGPFKATEEKMAAELKAYESNFSSPPSQIQLDTLKNTQEKWANYVKFSTLAAMLAYENANQKAKVLNDGMAEFWEGVDGELETLSANIAGMNVLRADLFRFRLQMTDFLFEEDAKAIQEKERELSAILDATANTLREVSAKTPADKGGDLAASIQKKLLETVIPAFKSIDQLVNQASNTKANAILNGEGLQAANALAEVTGNGLVIATKSMDDAINAGAARRLSRT